MRRLLVLMLLVAAVCDMADVSTAQAPVASNQAATDSTNGLALALLGSGSGNKVFSAYSIQAALTMAYQGAAGRTATEMGRVLGSGDAPTLAASDAALRETLSRSVAAPSETPRGDAVRLKVANGLWVQAGVALESPFVRTSGSDFGAAPQLVDFIRNPGAARRQINGFIASRTGGRIRNLLSAQQITRDIRLTLANAIYLKAHWASPFVKSMTSQRRFFPSGRRTVRVPFMTQPATEFAFARGSDYEAIDLPYLNSRLSMLVVLPRSMQRFQAGLTPALVAGIVRSLSARRVALFMPRFRLKAHIQLNRVLSRLGMATAFSRGADFSGITRQLSLMISSVDHGADLQVDEQGTVAAAATAITVEPTSLRVGPITRLVLNHPFLALIRDDASGAILFTARVADPSRG